MSMQPIQRRPSMHRLLFLGRPGSGKKLMANRFAESFRLYHGRGNVDFAEDQRMTSVSSGTLIMRAATDQDDENFREIGALLSRNGPVPDDLVGEMVSKSLKATELQGFVLRGCPRTRNQAELLDRYGFHPSKVFFFNCPTDYAKHRLLDRATKIREKAALLQKVYAAPQSFDPDVVRPGNLGFADEESHVNQFDIENRAFSENIEDIKTYYKDIAYEIDATAPEDDIFGQIKYHLLHPVPLRPRREAAARGYVPHPRPVVVH